MKDPWQILSKVLLLVALVSFWVCAVLTGTSLAYAITAGICVASLLLVLPLRQLREPLRVTCVVLGQLFVGLQHAMMYLRYRLGESPPDILPTTAMFEFSGRSVIVTVDAFYVHPAVLETTVAEHATALHRALVRLEAADDANDSLESDASNAIPDYNGWTRSPNGAARSPATLAS